MLNSQPRQPTGFGHWLSTVGEGFKDVQAMPVDSGYEFHWMSMTFSQIWMGEPPIASCRKCVGFTEPKSSCNSKSASACEGPVTRMQSLKPLLGTSNFNVETYTFKVSNKKSWHCPNLFHLFLRFNVAFEIGMSETGKNTHIYIYLSWSGWCSVPSKDYWWIETLIGIMMPRTESNIYEKHPTTGEMRGPKNVISCRWSS